MVSQSLQKSQPFQVFFVPLCLNLEYGLQGFGRKSITGMMERNRNPATIRMAVTLMAASLRAQKKLISDKSRDESSGRQAAKSAIIDRHTSHRNGYMWLWEYLHLMPGEFG